MLPLFQCVGLLDPRGRHGWTLHSADYGKAPPPEESGGGGLLAAAKRAMQWRPKNGNPEHERAACEYRLVNPSWLTCYPAHTHRGEIAFVSALDADGRATSLMTWRVCVRPQRLGGWAVKRLTSLLVSAFTRNLASRLGDSSDADVTSEWSVPDRVGTYT